MRAVSTVEFAIAFGFFRNVRVERKAAHDEQVKAHALHGLFGRFFDLLRPNRAMLGADGDGHALRDPHPDPPSALRTWEGSCFGVLAGRVQPGSGKRLQPVEFEPLFLDGVLHARFLEVLDDHRLELADAGFSLALGFGRGTFFVGWQHAMRREAFDGERPRDADALVVFVGLIVEQFGVGVTRDRVVNFLLPLAAQAPLFGVETRRPSGLGDLTVWQFTRDLPFFPLTA